MKIAFYSQHLTERGTSVAMFDYAKQNQQLLGNQTVVLYDKDHPVNNPDVVEKFRNTFELIPCQNFSEADQYIASENTDLLFVQKAGKRDGLVSKVRPTMVQSVFANSVRQVHGASYAYVSEWLAETCTGGLLSSVPHMISIGSNDEDLKTELNIPSEAIVFGCYGGRTSFDIDFVCSQVIPKVLETLPHTYFIFMNIEKFIDHPRVLFQPGSVDLERKTAFINTCDAMLHARRRGETFGLAIGEFSLRSKPVLTYGKSKERAHLGFLGDTAQIYRTADELYELIANFDPNAPSAANTFNELFAPKQVMQQFEENLIKPALTGDLNGASNRLGWRRWDPILLARPKVKKLLNQL